MIAQFTRSTTFIVGEGQTEFYLHTDLVERLCHNLKLRHGQFCRNGRVRMPLVDPKVFRLFYAFLHGIFPNLTWSNEQDRGTVVDLAVIAHTLGVISLQFWIAEIIIDEGLLHDRTKYCPGFAALLRAYDPETTDNTFFLRNMLADCYAHFGADNHFQELVEKDKHHVLVDLGFWQDFSDRCGWWRKVEDFHGRRGWDLPPRFRGDYYFKKYDPRITQPPPKMTRQGVEIFDTCFFQFNRIRIHDGKDPLLIHRSLTDTREDIFNGFPPHDIHFPSGWRPAVLMYMEWLYNGKVMWEVDTLDDLILAYCLELPQTTHFQNAVISAIVSWCARYAIVPSDEDIVHGYLNSEPGSPLRKFLAAWTVTHRAADSVDLTKFPPEIADCWEADVGDEFRFRLKCIEQELCHMIGRGKGEWLFNSIRGPCFWNGESLINENGLWVGPHYFDQVCMRFHIHDDHDDTRILGLGGNGGRECRDFHGPSDQLPYIVMYLPDGLIKSQREGWLDDDELDKKVLPFQTADDPHNHWSLTCPSNSGWPAFHRRMLLGNTNWLCRRTKQGVTYFLRYDRTGTQFIETSLVDPRGIKWARGDIGWSGKLPVYPSDGIPEYAKLFDEFYEEADAYVDGVESDEEEDLPLPLTDKDKKDPGGFANSDPRDNLDNFSLSEGSFPSDDEASDDGAASDGSDDGSEGDDIEDGGYKLDHSADNHDKGSGGESDSDGGCKLDHSANDHDHGSADGNNSDGGCKLDHSKDDHDDGSSGANDKDSDSDSGHSADDQDEGYALSDID
ncbi:hypothetical protein IWZ01DRAFT_538959 [Phyllosticta capitalensis]